MLTVDKLTQVYKGIKVVDGVTFSLKAGETTALIGPNGSGKSTILRMLVNLEEPSSGTAKFHGVKYSKLHSPIFEVGVMLDDSGAIPTRTGRQHLKVVALTHGISNSRIAAVLDEVGLTEHAHKRIRDYSLGMKQRLDLATALLGDPRILLLDEPTNGLDPAGHVWFNTLIRKLVSQGKLVLLTSHVMDDVSTMADRVLILNRGVLVGDFEIANIPKQATIFIKSPQLSNFESELRRLGGVVERREEHIAVKGLDCESIWKISTLNGWPLWELREENDGLVKEFFRLTNT